MQSVESTRRPLPASASILALTFLTPPSPILSPSQLSTIPSFSDIPIFLDNLSLDFFLEPSTPSTKTNPEIGWALSLSSSNETMGTFGPARMGDDGGSPSPRSSWRSSVNSTTLSPSPSITCAIPEYSKLTGAIPSPANLTSTKQILDQTRVVAAEGLVTSISAYLTSLGPRTTRLSISTSDVANEQSTAGRISPFAGKHHKPTETTVDPSAQFLRYLPPSHTFSTLPIPGFAPPSPSPSYDLTPSISCPSSPRSRRKFRLYPLERQPDGLVTVSGTGLPTNTAAAEESERLTASTSVASAASSRDPQALTPSLTVASSFVLVPPAVKSPSPSPVLYQAPHYPRSLLWLKSSVDHVELCIDQEGFREIKPSFKLCGFSSGPDACDPHGTADFMPVRHKKSFFHYAPLDSPPILRRLTVNGDESRDYISRQASLSLKSNGVYTVRGSETCVLAPSSPNAKIGKLPWKFDYVVDDRRNETTGKIMAGEKILTPLAFSCSPLLLHSLQGKKIRMMYIVRKSVAGKLAAEKVEPPVAPPVLVPPSPAAILTGKVALIPTTPTSPAHSLTNSILHRRAMSHVTKPPPPSGLGYMRELDSNGRTWKGGIPESISGTHRRRRASSAGEKRHIANSEHNPSLQALHEVEGATVTFGMPGKPILPKSQLAALFSAYVGDEHDSVAASPRDRSRTGLQAFNPRRYHGGIIRG
jgi:hypothetical protein